jgi:hypothetical protein
LTSTRRRWRSQTCSDPRRVSIRQVAGRSQAMAVSAAKHGVRLGSIMVGIIVALT